METEINESFAMPEPLFAPVELRFTGGDADKHHLDVEQFGKSIMGTAKLYNAAAHLFYTGSVPGGRTIYKIKMHTSAEIKESSVSVGIYAAMVMGEMAIYPQLWGDIAGMVIPDFVRAIYAKLVKRDSEVIQIYTKMIETMQEENDRSRQHTERIAQIISRNFLESQDQFLRTIENVSSNSRGAARDSVETIGRSTKGIEHHSINGQIIGLDQPIADALRSREEMTVADIQEFTGRLLGVDTITGVCKFEVGPNTFKGKITDPSLQIPQNIYTHSLDTQEPVTITAKPTLKGSQIHQLYISDARPAE